ncbi:YciI family protein [Gluconacetobacter azotocaptans]|uniref:YciI family protein n=1 Tax=Gluconacetobacter azotocaptans TaxID=142834 RepID=A0A7W4PDS1_9PROT|nr:YciI family protein [Gluconacetobacter azotocaptans]MBB2190018.1 YciI family protein [Gluconacetobacter azotocaptans]MBM9401811.1 YciI family protein [Gluconacetobacter azotocaptans]
MLFAIICTDKPGALDTRLATRAQHLAYLAAYQDRIVQAGPLLNLDGRPCGSLLLVDVTDRAAAEGFAASDPYARADVFESVVIRAYRTVFRDGGLVE